MPTYDYRCRACGPFELRRPMAEHTDAPDCPSCARPAGRVFAAPALRGMAAPMRGALDAQERSAHDPAVLTSVPPSRRRTPVSPDPRHARLPRP